MHAGGGFFGHTDDLGALAAVPGRVHGQLGLDGGEQAGFFFAGGIGDERGVLFGALAQVHQQCGIAAVVQNQVGAFAFAAGGAKVENAVRVIPVFGQGFALDREHRRARGGNGGGGVVLRGEDVARCPAHFGSQGLQRLDQHGRLDGHVQRAGDAGAFQRLFGSELLADGHQAGHFGFGDANFFAAPFGQADVGNDAVGVDGGVDACVHGVLQSMFEKPLDAGRQKKAHHTISG